MQLSELTTWLITPKQYTNGYHLAFQLLLVVVLALSITA